MSGFGAIVASVRGSESESSLGLQGARMSISELPTSSDTERSASQLHARGVLRERLIAEYPSVPPARIGALVDDAYLRTSGARVQVFRVILAEREVRAALGRATSR
jgi:hypothetical protein